jgi:hypothetical protein
VRTFRRLDGHSVKGDYKRQGHWSGLEKQSIALNATTLEKTVYRKGIRCAGSVIEAAPFDVHTLHLESVESNWV